MECQLCARSLADSEPIYRKSLGYNHLWWREFRGCIGFVCEACLDGNDLRSGVQWREAAPCCNCNRPVIADTRRNPRVLVCGQKCQRATYRKRRQSYREPHDPVCPGCRLKFVRRRRSGIYWCDHCLRFVEQPGARVSEAVTEETVDFSAGAAVGRTRRGGYAG
jgi:ribosomal protein L37AE/L43A